ncbi:MAG: hypothetical protein HOW97_14605 [Catenulispora sp.]|nr:hypothetical protein [Catenulispora sp.]
MRNTEHTEEMDWARDLFDGARGEAEPFWGADAAAISRAGDRRRRLRTAGTGGGLLGLVAVTTAVAVTLGAGTTDFGSAPGPGGGWGGRKLQDVFRYAQVDGGSGALGQKDFSQHVPRSAAVDLAALIGHLDPAGAHLLGSPAGPAREQPRIVGDRDSGLKDTMSLAMSSTWTADGSYPGPAPVTEPEGRLSYSFFKNADLLRGPVLSHGTVLPEPCGLAVDFDVHFGMLSGDAALPHWSPCRYTTLSDGSRIGTTSAAYGTGTETVAVRIFDTGNMVALSGWDFPRPDSSDWTVAPDPKTVVKPSPWSEAGFQAALSDPQIGPVFAPLPPRNADGKFLDPADIGPYWVYDPNQGPLTTGEFVMDNGCTPDHSIFGLAPGSALQYQGMLPGGFAGPESPTTALEGEYRLPAGTGPATMRAARTYASGGCDQAAPFGFSKDTVIELPAGIGDDAFVEDQPQMSRVRVYVRFGDTVLETVFSRPSVQPLDVTSAAGRTWVQGVARKMAEHWASASAPATGK